MSDFGEFRVVKTRKDCRCAWCGETIPKGSEVTVFDGMWQGEWQWWKMHDECLDACRESDPYVEGFDEFNNERPKVEETKQ